MLEIATIASTLLIIATLLHAQRKITKELRNIRIPPPQKIEFPKIELPKIELPQAPVTAELLRSVMDAQGDLIKNLQEIAALMRVNEAEFQSGLEAFHKAADRLLAQIPSGEKELGTQKEFMRKFEEAFAKAQEAASEAMSENSLRLQEILAEFLGREAK